MILYLSSKPLTKSTIPVNNAMIQNTFDHFNNSLGIDESLKEDPSRESMKENELVNTLANNNQMMSSKGMIAIIWIIGSCITLMYCVIPYIHLKLRIRNTSTDPDPEDITIFHRFI